MLTPGVGRPQPAAVQRPDHRLHAAPSPDTSAQQGPLRPRVVHIQSSDSTARTGAWLSQTPTDASRSHDADSLHHARSGSRGRGDALQSPRSGTDSDIELVALARKRRVNTFVEQAPVSRRTYNRKYLFRRPRPLQVTHHGVLVELGSSGKLDLSNDPYSIPGEPDNRRDKTDSAVEREEDSDNIEVQRERMDIFVDLMWVGIISNISENFYAQVFENGVDIGDALSVFILNFVPAWRIWVVLQQFLNSYYMDTLIQRAVIFWVLVLGLIWGNNAPYFLDSSNNSDFTIASYLIAVKSILILENTYMIWLPWLRRKFLVTSLVALPVIGAWTAATIVGNTDIKIRCMTAAICYDLVTFFILASPVGDYLLGQGTRKAQDSKHTIRRFENFFIIALGEGVFLLLRGSPLGQGLGTMASRGILAFTIYYFLTWSYFLGDSTKTFIHAAHRRWWIKLSWETIHVPMFAALVIMSSGILYLVGYSPEGDTAGIAKRDQPATVSVSAYTRQVASATVCISLSVVLACQTVVTLLNRSLDKPGTLRIHSRALRIAPRCAIIIILAVLWLADFSDPTNLLQAVTGMTTAMSIWEWFAGMDAGGGLMEPKEEHALEPVTSR